MTTVRPANRAVILVSTVINRVLAPLGMRISRVRPPLRNTHDLARSVLVGKHEPFVVDVGAASGNFAAAVLQAATTASVVCIEPIPSQKELLRRRFADQNVCVIQSAIGDRDGEVVFHEAVSADCSSVLTMGRHQREFPTVSAECASYTVPLRRLDTVFAEAPFRDRPIDLLKIDTQGYELPVLMGGVDTLRRCQNIIVEISLQPLYQGQASFEEVVYFLWDQGFRVVDYSEGARSHVSRELVQMDFLCSRRW